LALAAAAAVTSQPVAFLGAGLVVYLLVLAAGVALATRRLPAERRRRARRAVFGAWALLGILVFVVTVLVPVGDPRRPPAPVAGQRFWDLPTGSRIAYVERPAGGRPRPTPVVFVHGGPGIADMAGDTASFGQLTADGYDVRSTTRSAPAAPRAWPTRAATTSPLVFSSPGALAPAVDDGSGGRVRARLTPGQQLGLYRLLARLRTPALVVKGSCDYLSWSSGQAYLRAVPGSRLAYLHHAGHNSYQDQPAALLATVRAFLAGRPLPEPAWTGTAVPADYEGPP